MLYKPAEGLQSGAASIPKSEGDPSADAWLTNFFTENHLDFETQPDEVASPEQVRFVVHLPENAVYYPCSTELFEAILKRQSRTYLHERYQEVWRVVERLVQDLIADEISSSHRGLKKGFLKFSLIKVKSTPHIFPPKCNKIRW
jgi:hypothetical protein